MLPKNARQLFIDGPVGQLDCLELKPSGEIIGIAIICHPDPKGGGTYTNKVVQTLARVLNQKGYLCYCPNLRSVGMSEGIHDMGIGEVDDIGATYAFIRNNYVELPIILAGFSFGCSVVSQFANQIEHKKLILIGPAVTRYTVTIPDINKTIVVHGELDEVIPLEDVFTWARKYDQAVIWIPGSGHFFHGKLMNLQNLIASFAL